MMSKGMMMRPKKYLPISSLFVLSLLGTAANAQSVPAGNSVPTDTSNPAATPVEPSSQLADIVVTAQKRAENLQSVPIAVKALTGAELAEHGVTATTELNTVVPGLNVRSTFGSFQPTIRGIGTSTTSVENPVSLYIDGVYYPAQRDGLRDLIDIEQIAVLRGPQGTLFGRNSTAGVIQIQTRAPRHEFEGQAALQVDNYATVRADLYLTGGLAEHLTASLSGQYVYQGNGWGKDYTTGNDTYRITHQIALRGKLLFEPTSRTSFLLIGDYLNQHQFGGDLQPYPGTSFSFPGVGPLKTVYDTYGGTDGQLDWKSGGISLTAKQDLSFAKVLSISSYRKALGFFIFDNSGVAQSYAVSRASAPIHTFTQELQLVSTKGRFNWVLGAFYFHNSNSSDPVERIFSGILTPLPTSLAISTTRATELTNSVAGFAQADWEIIPKTKVTAGVRYTYENRDFNGSTVAQRANGVSFVQASRTDALSISRPTVRLALDHHFTDDVLGYVSFNTGFKSGGFNVGNPGSSAYLPESLKAYEIGLKTELLDKRLRVNVAGFYYKYTNVQVSQLVGTITTVANGAGAELYGADIDFDAKLSRELRLSGGVEVEHANFTLYPGAVFSTPLATGGARLFFGNASGNRLPLSQKLSGNASINYHKQISSGDVDADLTGSYNGDYYFEADSFLHQGAYVLLNSSVRWTAPNHRLSVALFGKNLFDQHIITLPTTQSIGYPTGYSQPPRTYGIAFRTKF